MSKHNSMPAAQQNVVKGDSSHNSINSVDELASSSWGQQAANPETRAQIPQQLESFIRRLGNKHPMASRATKALQLFNEGCIGPYFNTRNSLILAAAILYTISPIDAIPDMIPVIGWLDDIGILAMAFSFLRRSKDTPEEAAANTSAQAAAEEEEPASIPPSVLENIARQCADMPTHHCRSLQEKLVAQRAEIAALDDAELMARQEELEAAALDPMRRVVVTGAFNAGKSSIINRLLEDDCLPTHRIPTTPVLTTLMHGETLRVLVNGKDGSCELLDDPAAIRDIHSATTKNAQEILIHHPAPILSNGFSIVDTPGIEHAWLVPLEEQPRSEAFIFVTSARIGSWTTAEAAFLQKVAEKGLINQLILVFNKTDLASSAQAVESIVEEKCASLLSFGLRQVPVFRLRADGAEGDEFPAFQEELLRRAQSSMQNEHERSVNEAADGLRKAAAQLRRHRAEQARLSAHEQARRQQALARLQRRTEETVDRHINTLRAETSASLHHFLRTTLQPELYRMMESAPLNEQLPGRLSALTRQSLETWLNKACADLSANLGQEMDADDRKNLAAHAAELGIMLPENSIGDMARFAQYVLPGIALVTFFPMGIFSWLTTVAAPTFFLDKFGADKALSRMIQEFGSSMVRIKLREQVNHEVLPKLEMAISAKLTEILMSAGSKLKAARCKALEATL